MPLDIKDFWTAHAASLKGDGWIDGSRLPRNEGNYDVVFTNSKRGKAWFDGTRFFTPDVNDGGRVFAYKPSVTAPAHALAGDALPIGLESFTHYESATAEEQALQSLAEDELMRAGLAIEITMARVNKDASGAMTVQRVLAQSEHQAVVFDGTRELKSIAKDSLDRPLEFSRPYTIDFRNGQGTVFDGIRYTITVKPSSSAPGNAMSLAEKLFIEKEILQRVQHLTPNEMYAGFGSRRPVDIAIADALLVASKFFSSTPRQVDTVLVNDALAVPAAVVDEETFDEHEAQRA